MLTQRGGGMAGTATGNIYILQATRRGRPHELPSGGDSDLYGSTYSPMWLK